MTDQDPQLVNLRMPVDTITQKTHKVVLAMMLTEDETIAHFLVMDTDFGCYRFQLSDDAVASLLAQCVAHHELGERLLREQENQ